MTAADTEKSRTYYQDPYNDCKVWEVVRLHGGFYLRQYICGRLFGRGVRTTMRHICDIGIPDFEKIDGFCRV